jgi:ribosomal protein S27E
MKPKVVVSCPECNSKGILYQKKNKSFWCRRCGYEWKKQIKEVV